jgi:hypothetical protein
MDEVGTAVLAISLVLISVFVPTAFIPGISGQFYLQFAITIAVSTAISAFNSLTLSPALAGVLFKPHHSGPPSGNPVARFGRSLADGFNNGAYIVGAPLGGVIVASVGPGWGIGVDAVAFMLSAVAFALLRLPTVTRPGTTAAPERNSILRDLRAGWSEFRGRTWLWVVVTGFAVINAVLSGGMSVLGPVVADETVGRRAWGLVLATQTVGMVLGALVAMRVTVSRLLFFGIGCVAFEVFPVLALGVAPHLGVLLAAAFLAGLGIEQFSVAWETTMQEHVPADRLARVYSYDMVGSFVAIPVGQVAAGPIAQAAGVGPTLVGAAVVIGLAVVGMLASRDVRNVRHRLPTSRQSAGAAVEESTA